MISIAYTCSATRLNGDKGFCFGSLCVSKMHLCFYGTVFLNRERVKVPLSSLVDVQLVTPQCLVRIFDFSCLPLSSFHFSFLSTVGAVPLFTIFE